MSTLGPPPHPRSKPTLRRPTLLQPGSAPTPTLWTGFSSTASTATTTANNFATASTPAVTMHTTSSSAGSKPTSACAGSAAGDAATLPPAGPEVNFSSDEVIFECTVLRRGTALNCPNTLGSIGQRHPQKHRSSAANLSPPSKELILEEYFISMSRHADIGELKMKLQKLSGILAKDLIICAKEEGGSNANDTNNSITKFALSDKEVPPGKLLHQQQVTLDHFSLTANASARIFAFEMTLVVRPIDLPTNLEQSVASTAEEKDDVSTTADEASTDSSSHSFADIYQNSAEEKIVQEYLKIYGDEKECVICDTNPTALARVISRSLWPKSAKDFTLGLRVDAIDHRKQWFPGSVVDIFPGGTESNPDGEDTGESMIKVKVHFDNFDAKWDEIYSIGSFNKSRVCPLYSHTFSRQRPIEIIVHNRGLDHKTEKRYLFGQSFFIQCYNEWTLARAGAHILAQASRFLEDSPFQPSKKDHTMGSNDQQVVEEERHHARKVSSRLIEALVVGDRKRVKAAIESGRQSLRHDDHASPFDASSMSRILTKKLTEVLPLLPFDVRISTTKSPLENDNETPFPFSLVHTVGNYINARHCIVLHWRDKAYTRFLNKKRPGNMKQLLYSPPFLATHKQSEIRSLRDENARLREDLRAANERMSMAIYKMEEMQRENDSLSRLLKQAGSTQMGG